MDQFIYEKLKEISSYIRVSVGTAIFVTVLVTVLIFKNYDKFLLCISSIQSLFLNVSASARKGTIKNRIRGNVLAAKKKIGASSILPEDVEIQWIKDEDPQVFFKDKQAVIRLSNSRNPHENTTKVVTLLVKEGAAVEAKRYFTTAMQDATNYTLTRKLLYLIDEHALDFYDKYIISAKMVDEDHELKKYIERFVRLDYSGLFIIVFLNEVTKYSKRIYPLANSDQIRKNIIELLEYLNDAAEKLQKGEPIENNYRKGPFRFTLAFTAKNDTLNAYGEEYYVDRIIRTMTEGKCNTEYFFALGSKQTVAKSVISKMRAINPSVIIIEHPYLHFSEDGKKIEALCYEIQNKDLI